MATLKTRDILRINHVANGTECPECGERGSRDWNGERGELCSYSCQDCGVCWDAAFWFAKLSEDEQGFIFDDLSDDSPQHEGEV